MPGDSDLKLAEMLAARLCHDMAGPLAAVSNGLELLDDPDFGADAEAMDLLNGSVGQAAASLRFLRSAFGTASEAEGDPAHLRALAADWMGRRRIQLEWQLRAAELPPEVGRLLLNQLGLLGEVLPRGGVVTLTETATPAAQRFTGCAEGSAVHLRPELRQGLEGESPEDLGPRGAQAYLLRRLADRLDGRLQLDVQGEERLVLDLVL